jgi:UDP-N-acetylmuramyl pentapeptide synthase
LIKIQLFLKYTSSDIAKIINGKLTGNPGLIVSDVVTDSRQISYSEEMAFFAIRGKNHDGHQFIKSLYDKGIRVFVVEELPTDSIKYADAAFIVIKNSVSALQKVAASKRKSFKSDVIAITGSTGKTIVKEWLADILGLYEPVVRSPRSYNSQIGVPLSVWKLDEKYKAGIFEAGISLPGEMEKLREIIDPGIGVITNIGDAHSENFPDNTAKAKEKLKLFANSSLLVYSRDQKLLHELIRNDKLLKAKVLVDWSFSDKEAAVYVNKRQLSGKRTQMEIVRGTRL